MQMYVLLKFSSHEMINLPSTDLSGSEVSAVSAGTSLD